MAKRKSNKQIKQIMVGTARGHWEMVAVEVWWTKSYGVCVEYIDGGYGDFSIGGLVQIYANGDSALKD